MKPVARDVLMQYFDGELSEEQAAALRQDVVRDHRALATLNEWADVGAALRCWSEERAAQGDIADAVMQQIEDGRPSRLRVIEGGASAQQAEATAPGKSARVRATSRGRLRWPHVVAGSMSVVAAAAAAWLLFLEEPTSKLHALVPVHSAIKAAEAVRNAAGNPGDQEIVGETLDLPAGAEIETVDFGGQGGAIFMVSAGATAMPVVWLSDEPEEQRVEPL